MGNQQGHLVVIGNGMAGAAFLERFRDRDPGRPVTVIGEEPHGNYNRILLSPLLGGEVEESDVILHPPEWYATRGIRLLAGTRVTRVDLHQQCLETREGPVIAFETLVLATGSRPVFPPLEGLHLPGVFGFRTLDDARAIRAWARGCRKALVIGGGLLGLEAARGLTRLGLEVTVAHLMGHLMEQQLDPQAGAILRNRVESLGIQVLLEHRAVAILGEERVEGVAFDNGTAREAELVVVAAGIRPNVELAREAGLRVARGIVVDDHLETSHPGVYALGECAEHRGRLYGIVAPFLEQAEVLARVLTGDPEARYEGSLVVTRLKVADIPLVSMGHFQGALPGCEEVVFSDPAAGIYRKVVLQGGRVVGAILLGDLEGESQFLEWMRTRVDVSRHRRHLLWPESTDATVSVATLPDDAVICGCMGVTKGTLVHAIQTYGLTSKQEVAEKTRACTGCKGCGPKIDQLLQEILGGEYVAREAASPPLCGCFDRSWEEIREAVQAQGLRSVRAVLEALGQGPGCGICKPGLRYMLQELWIRDYEEDPGTALVNDRFHANIQKDGTFSVVPRIYGGVTTPEQLRRIADVAVRYRVPLVKITGGQRIDLLGVQGEDLPHIWQDLGMPSGHAYTKAVRTCKTCVGSTFCRFGVQDSIALGIQMEQRYQGIPCPGKLKMGVSGCPRNCAEATIKDIGVVGIQNGWEIYIGGNGGAQVRVADRLAVVSTPEAVFEIVDVFLQYYRESARWLERTSHFVERVGLDHIRAVVLEDRKGIRERLRRRMEEVVAAYRDPWAEAVETESGVVLP